MEIYTKMKCIKSISPTNDRNFIKDKYYNCHTESPNTYWVIVDKNINFGYRFFDCDYYNYNFSNYFITMKKERNKKLKKLNDV